MRLRSLIKEKTPETRKEVQRTTKDSLHGPRPGHRSKPITPYDISSTLWSHVVRMTTRRTRHPPLSHRNLTCSTPLLLASTFFTSGWKSHFDRTLGSVVLPTVYDSLKRSPPTILSCSGMVNYSGSMYPIRSGCLTSETFRVYFCCTRDDNPLEYHDPLRTTRRKSLPPSCTQIITREINPDVHPESHPGPKRGTGSQSPNTVGIDTSQFTSSPFSTPSRTTRCKLRTTWSNTLTCRDSESKE